MTDDDVTDDDGTENVCARCGEEYSLAYPDLEPTKHCDECAHLVVDLALGIASRYAQIDGQHHKAWVIDQMVRALAGSSYDEWIRQYKADGDDPYAYKWDEGVAP